MYRLNNNGFTIWLSQHQGLQVLYPANHIDVNEFMVSGNNTIIVKVLFIRVKRTDIVTLK